MNFALTWQWLSSLHEAPEVRETGAMLKIALGAKVVTQNLDEWSRTVSDDVRVSAYPLALWFASNWWRLRWEALPDGSPGSSWRMAHEVAAAGYGYVWPQVLFASDGETIHIWAASSPDAKQGPVKYLAGAHGEVMAGAFERVLDDFFGGVIARLDAVGIRDTSLHDLLAELAEERASAELTAYRRLEASAGFDPGEGPASILDQLEGLIPQAGLDAAQEVATLCASRESGDVLQEVIGIANQPGVRAQPDSILVEVGQADVRHYGPAWVRGKEFAGRLRTKLGLNGQAVSDAKLCEMLGVNKNDLADVGGRAYPPLGLAIREPKGRLSLHLRKHRPEAMRFELARVLSDHAFATPDDRWLPITDAKTSRQKAQRAFAAEFLCPIDSVREFLGSNFSDDAIDEVAHHFHVSPMAVHTQLVNNGDLPRNTLPDFGGSTRFPYAV